VLGDDRHTEARGMGSMESEDRGIQGSDEKEEVGQSQSKNAE